MPQELPNSRKEIAIHLLESGFDIHTVKDLLDHADITMALIYIHFERYCVGVNNYLSILRL
jgi:site-specific recombinase XerD